MKVILEEINTQYQSVLQCWTCQKEGTDHDFICYNRRKTKEQKHQRNWRVFDTLYNDARLLKSSYNANCYRMLEKPVCTYSNINSSYSIKIV